MNSQAHSSDLIADRPAASGIPFVLFARLMFVATSFTAAAGEFAVAQRDDRIVITHDGTLVAHYVFQDPKILRPYFAHVRTPDGLPVTRNHPPVAGTDPADHDTMHPGLWLAFGDLSGRDFWRNKATIRHERFSEKPSSRKDELTFATESALIGTNGDALANLSSQFSLSSRPNAFLLAWDAAITPMADGFYFGDQEEMGFGVRVATSISEKNGGVIRTSEGLTSAKATWGKTAAWSDYSGILSNRLAGVMLVPDPKNFRASWFHNRDYGLMVANPFGQKAFAQGEASRVPVKRGETFHLRFIAFVHSTATNHPPDLSAVYNTITSGK